MLYCAYGSNMNIGQMAYRCPNSHVVDTCNIRGWQIVFNTHADIIETGNYDDVLPVVVWEVPDEDWESLDIYEGYPLYYIKRDVVVEFYDGRKENAVAYVMADDRKGIYPPTRSYFDTIIEGCESNDIDTEYLYDAMYRSFDVLYSSY